MCARPDICMHVCPEVAWVCVCMRQFKKKRCLCVCAQRGICIRVEVCVEVRVEVCRCVCVRAQGPKKKNEVQFFFDGYCSTVQGLLDWFDVDLGFTELSLIQIDLCVLCVFVLYSRVSLSYCPFLNCL